MKLERKKIALVTGGGRGIGRAIAERLGADGIHVEIADVVDEMHVVSDAITAQGGLAHARKLDVTDEAAIQVCVEELVTLHGGIDILVNNAGISPKLNGRKFQVDETSLDGWWNVLNVNLTGAFLLSRACMPVMRSTGWGRIINITSLAARTRPEATSAHYAASKAGLMGFSRVLATELAGDGVTVNCVAPGTIETPLFDSFSSERKQNLLSRIPVKRFGNASDVAGAVSYLASEEAGYLTGVTIDVNGGLFMP